MNKFASQLASEVRSRFSVDSSNMSPSDWICKNTTLRGMPFNFRKFPFQKQIVDDMHPNLSCTKVSQIGLALDLDTPVLTTQGWSSMGDLQIGDRIYAPDGTETAVTYVSPVYTDHECFELTFCDGERIVADANHRWYVIQDSPASSEVVTTLALYNNPNTPNLWIPAIPGLEQGDPSPVMLSIHSIQPLPTRPVRCITVDHPSHLFLAGKSLVATHNTEVQIRKAAAFVARNRGRTLLFTFPNEEMQKKTSQTRIQPLLNENRVFNLSKEAGVPQIRSYNIIQIDSSFLMVTGCSEGEATSTPADAVFNDEVDLSPQDMLALFSSRMQASDLRIRQQFSTPTFEGFGISQVFETSDQHEYFVKCDACGHQQVPLFDRKWIRIPGLLQGFPLMDIDQSVLDKGKIDLNAAYVACERCKAELDLGRADNREWVAKYPHRTNSRGYRVRPFSVNTLPVGYIVQKMLEYRSKGFMRGWYNTVLGETFNDGDVRLTDDIIMACFSSRSHIPAAEVSARPTFIGIDLGLTCHIVLLQPQNDHGVAITSMEAVLFEVVRADDLVHRVDELCKQYTIVGGAVDRHPYTPTANALFDHTGGRIKPCEYRGNAELNDKIDTNKCIQANRTDLLDTVARVIRNKQILLSGYGSQIETIKEHLKDMVREEAPEKAAVWVKLKGADHYFHALGFAFTAVKLYTGDFIGPGQTRLEHRSTVFLAGAGTTAQETLKTITGNIPSKSAFNRGGSFHHAGSLGLR